jgi:hypothetical protein
MAREESAEWSSGVNGVADLASVGSAIRPRIVSHLPEALMTTEWDDSLPERKTLAFASRIE